MKLLTLRCHDSHNCAVMMGDLVLDLVLAGQVIPLARRFTGSLRSLLAEGTAALEDVRRITDAARRSGVQEQLEELGALKLFEQATLAPVVPDGELVLAGSMNSLGHLAEMGDELPQWPCAFRKVRSALCASGTSIAPPPEHAAMLDWEGELCVVIGTRCHRVSASDAPDYIAGYTLLNDVSAREYVMPFVRATGPAATAQAWERNVLGKNFPTFGPIGPVMATRDELPEPLAYHMETLVNGAVMQSSTGEDLVFGPAQMLSYFSHFYIFQPGDIISMGSPPGVGMARQPQVFLQAGDVVEVRVKEIGRLVNSVASPAPVCEMDKTQK